MKAVNQLVQQITEWTKDTGWTVTTAREINEENVGARRVPDATIDAPQGYLTLEVKSRGRKDRLGRIELRAWPTLYRVLLRHRMGAAD